MNSTYRSKPLPALFAGALGLDAAVLGGWLVLVASKAVAESGRQTRAVLRFLQFYESFIERNCAPGNVCEVRLDSIPAHSLFMATDIKRMSYHSQTGNRAIGRAREIWRSPQSAEP